MSKRREKGTGSVSQQADGGWRGYLTLDGQRRYVYGATRAIVREKLAALRARHTAGVTLERTEVLRTYLPAWLEAQADLAAVTRREYARICTSYLIPALGTVRLEDLKKAQVRTFLADLATAGKGARTRQLCFDVLRMALAQAVSDDLILRTPCDPKLRPVYRAPEKPALTPDQVQALLAHESRYAPLWAVLVLTGLRRGEVWALRWQDVDLGAGRLTVATALDVPTRTRHAPKTAGSRRTVDLPPAAIAAVQRQRQHLVETHRPVTGAALVFPNQTGALPMNARNVYLALHADLAALSLPKMGLHGLRHTYASLLDQAEVGVAVAMRLLGHTNLSTTSRYIHVDEAAKRQAVGKLGALLAPDAPPSEEHG